MRTTLTLFFVLVVSMTAVIVNSQPAAGQQTPTATPTPKVPASAACAAEEIQLSAYEGTRVGEVTIEIAAAVSRSCNIWAISASLIDASGKLVPNAVEARAETEIELVPPGERVVGTVVWSNWCAEEPLAAPGPYGLAATVNGKPIVVSRLASIPFCWADRGRAPVLGIEIAAPPTPLIVLRPRLDAPVRPGELSTWAELLDHFVVYADGQVCGSFSLVDPAVRNGSGDAVFLLGLPRQPVVCSTAGIRICLATEARGQQAALTMFKKFTLEPGRALTFDNFAPDPPQDPGPQPTCAVPNPTPQVPAAGTGFAPHTISNSGLLALALGAVLTASSLAIGLRAHGTRRL